MSKATTFFSAVGIIVLLVVCAVLAQVAGWVDWGFQTAEKSAKGVIEKTVDPNNVIFQYEMFFDKAAYYDSTIAKIKSAEAEVKAFEESAGPRENWTFEDKNEASRLRTVLTGLKQTANDVATEYNAASAKVNKSLFKDKNLPETLEVVE